MAEGGWNMFRISLSLSLSLMFTREDGEGSAVKLHHHLALGMDRDDDALETPTWGSVFQGCYFSSFDSSEKLLA